MSMPSEQAGSEKTAKERVLDLAWELGRQWALAAPVGEPFTNAKYAAVALNYRVGSEERRAFLKGALDAGVWVDKTITVGKKGAFRTRLVKA